MTLFSLLCSRPQPCPSIRTKALDVQRDGSSCGFWALIYALGCLLGCPDKLVLKLGINEVKELLGNLYASLIGHEVGLQTELLHNLTLGLKPSIDIMGYLPSTVRIPSNAVIDPIFILYILQIAYRSPDQEKACSLPQMTAMVRRKLCKYELDFTLTFPH